MALNGISALIAVSQMKVDNANQDALEGAKNQQSLLPHQKSLHAAFTKFELVKAGAGTLEAVRARFENSTKDLESQDKLGNFEIQDLMSSYNQAETLASSLLKKKDDTASSIFGKI